MLRNYFTIAIRNLMRYKVYSFINILGLAIGMAFCVLVLMLVQKETAFDRDFVKGERIYRVIRETRIDGGKRVFRAMNSGALAAALENDFPEVERAVRKLSEGEWFCWENETFHAQVGLVDGGILDVFDLGLVRGEKLSVLAAPFSAVVTQQAVERFFGGVDPVGQQVEIVRGNLKGLYRITGVLDEVPKNSTFNQDFLITATFNDKPHWVWDKWLPQLFWTPLQTYVLLRDGVSPEDFERKLPDFMVRHLGAEEGAKNTYHLQSVEDIHLYSQRDYGIPEGGDVVQLYLMGVLAVFVLVIACINFITLATARSVRRAKEVGLRKVVGAVRFQLVKQFLGETLLFALIALPLALGLTELSLPLFGEWTGVSLEVSGDIYVGLLPILLGIVVVVGTVSGFYPALFLSGFRPAAVLKGEMRTGSKAAGFRKGLVVFQFAISIFLIVGTIVVYRQLDYMQNASWGFENEHMVVLPIFSDSKNSFVLEKPLGERYQTVKQAFLAHPDIVNATALRFLIGVKSGLRRLIQVDDRSLQIRHETIDRDFLETFGVTLVAGRNFRAGDRGGVVLINETAANRLGWADPVGQILRQKGEDKRVIGVVKDFHEQSLHHEIGSVVFHEGESGFADLVLKVRSGNMVETLVYMEKTWQNLLPDRAFRFSFLDERLSRQYWKEATTG